MQDTEKTTAPQGYRRMKLLMLLMLSAVLCLSAVIASMQHPEPVPEPVETPPPAVSSSVTLFVGRNGLWGARAANGRTLIEPTWYYLRTMSDTVLIARRSDGKKDRFGLIRTNGELMVPFLYTSIAPAASGFADVWIASFTENNREYYHLYHSDGTRWSDTAWDNCRFEGGTLYADAGDEHFQGEFAAQGIVWQNWETEYRIGLHRMTMAFDAPMLQRLPQIATLRELGEFAAAYLCYLFVTHETPDASLLSAEENSTLRNAYRYVNCRLRSAEVVRVKRRDAEGLPSYLVQMHVIYEQREDGESMELIETSMLLTVSRNADGAYIYSGFSDAQRSASV